MRRKNGTIVRAARRLAVCGLLLWNFAGQAMAQGDGQYVIKKGDNYLTHAGNTLGNATAFSPDCIWYSGTTYNPSGTHHNYYYYDGANYRFLSAPLSAGSSLSLSSSLPSTTMLRNTDEAYYFYDWDNGVARGHQYNGVANSEACTECGGVWGDGQCWAVYWIEYNSTWKTSAKSYNPTDNAASYISVAVTEHEKEVTSISAGELAELSDFSLEYEGSQSPSISAGSYTYTYIPAYTTYVFEGNTHNYYNSTDNGTSTPGSATSSGNTVSSYEWTVTGEGAQYLTLTNATTANPTITYSTSNNTGHKTATLTLTVTYSDGSTQVRTATVTVKTPCQNPTVTAVATYEGVTLSWTPTAESYKVYWKKDGGSWSFAEVGNVTSYTITGLAYNQAYQYKVRAVCGGVEQSDIVSPPSVTTKEQPKVLVYGAVFGGGRMADVTGKTEVVIINCDSISAVYGGNDIAGAVSGDNGSKITLGVNAGDAYSTAYNSSAASTKVRVGDVYGGGNGYYAYNGTSFEAATKDYTSHTVSAGASVKAMTQSHTVGDAVWTNGASPTTLSFPSIVKTDITVTNDIVKVDSIFGGAKNAFLTANIGNGSTITINGGTVYAVFGGNNWGGSQGYGKHHIDVTGTKTNLSATTGFGRTFGIGYLFGGGNKVYGSTTEITVTGGQIDVLFGGGNSADVYAANVVVNCAAGADAGDHKTFGSIYSNAISSYSAGTITTKDINNYAWDGTGLYNVRTLFGGNNEATMSGVPNITLTSGSVGVAYGGGNAGDMLAQASGSIDINDTPLNSSDDITFKYGTHVELNSATMLVDYLYGGCNMSNVDYSTWVEIKNGHVGTVYGGCNVSGDVGSTRVNPSAAGPKSAEYQAVYGATYVVANGGVVHNNLFAGSNGYYHCNNGISYVSGINYGDTEGHYIGMAVPTHNETNVIVKTGVTVKGNVYAGGNLACVGFTDATVGGKPFPQFVGWASVRMSGGTVEGSVFGGGNMASIYGSNEVQVSGGTISGALYGGNDRTGQVGQITNRVLPSSYDVASDGHTSLTNPEVKTYVGITGNPTITTVYGGGNGDYIYEDVGAIQYCGESPDYPIQSNTFVDIGINGGAEGGHIGTVYGGGNGVTVTGFITVFLNYATSTAIDNVGTIFGGNNKGDLALVPDIILLNGQVGTVYGGCNQGAMTATGNNDTKTITSGGNSYTGIGSYVRLRDSYTAGGNTATPNIKVSNAIYGGCRMNGVTSNSLVLVEGGNHSTVGIYGGCDISGTVSGTSQVVVNGGTVGAVCGGGNGDYDYDGNNVYVAGSSHIAENLIATGSSTVVKPSSANSRVDMLSGTAANLYAGGNACGSGATVMQVEGGTVTAGIYGGCNSSGTVTGNIVVNINGGTLGTSLASMTSGIFGGGYGASTGSNGNVTVTIGDLAGTKTPTIYGDVYGGSALGNVNDAAADITTVNFLNGTLHGNIYGGGLGAATLNGNGYVTSVTTEAIVNGTVHVNIGDSEQVSNSVTIDGNVFGCNNLAGSPKGHVYVDVYHTAHTEGNYYPSPEPATAAAIAAQSYAIPAVYGGGNLAHYTTDLSGASTHVHIHNCDNTIQYVYGGGNAANSPATDVTIDGGRFEYIFGGGNGAGTGNPGANVTNTASITVGGGIIDYVFGGSNTLGNVGATSVDFPTPGCTRLIKELYGGGNQAPITNNVEFTIPCGLSGVSVVYGGSRNADIGTEAAPCNVVLNVNGGTLENVFGGNNAGGTIWGNVTVNLYGGTITDVFGGNNAGGNIKGTITVNVIEDEALVSCPLNVTNIYGGGNNAAYTPASATASSPLVNVNHKKSGTSVTGNVYGGGKGATAVVTSYPVVTIGDVTVGHESYIATVGGSVYGGGDAAAVTGNTTVTIQKSNSTVGNAYGGGNAAAITGTTSLSMVNGAVGNLYGGGNSAGVSGSATVSVSGGNVSAGVYGGCNSSGSVGAVTVSLTGGQVGTSGVHADVYGGGYGSGTSTTNDIGVTLNGTTVYGDIYGGSALGAVNASTSNNTTITISSNTLHGNIFGGGKGSNEDSGTTATSNGNVIIDYNTANDNLAGLYGGANVNGLVSGNIAVNINANVGASGSGNSRDVFGGGYGANTNTSGNVTVTVGNKTGTITPLIYGDIYGGSALGNVNDAAADITTVNFLNGTLHGNIYGGGLGDKSSLGEGHSDIAAKVNGAVVVNIGASDQEDNNCKIDLRDADIYGCNNTNGSPQDDVTVNVYKTAHNYSDYESGNNYTAADGADPYYSIRDVFGGGNLADYAPENGLSSSTKKTTVNVIGCNNTIRRVFGGGNAAAATGVACVIDGGRFLYIFGGGNGETSAANIGAGGTNLAVHGGKITYLFGGSNTSGTISGSMNTSVDNSSGCTENIAEFFGGSNLADLSADITTTIACGTKFGDVYGGCNLADITGNVTLTVNGGTMSNVYAGSKGRADDPETLADEAEAANITGNTTLHIYGGAIGNAFGGSNINGNITGSITVDMDWSQSDCASPSIGNIYGASNLASYTPTTAGSYPAVTIKHGTVTHSVYGGGKGSTAAVTSNPCVTIGDNNGSHYAVVTENVYGGGDAAPVSGNTTVTYNDNNASSQVAKLFGGGNAAGVSGTSLVTLTSGKVSGGVYGGCNTSGTVGGNITVNANGGTVGASGVGNEANVHGGGYGQSTATNGNVTVNINGATVYGDVYGGSALGNVNDASNDITAVNVSSGTIHGNVYGGGLGQTSPTSIAALVNGTVHVTMSGGTVDHNVFGCNNVNGAPKSMVTVDITGGTVTQNVYGGGNLAAYTGSASYDSPIVIVTVSGASAVVSQNVFGGGKGASAAITGNTKVYFNRGLVSGNIYGGGELAPVNGGAGVNISQGVVGTASTPTTGFVFGGGYGVTATVAKTTVSISGGEIKSGVFGGGELAAVMKSTGGSTSYTFNKLKTTSPYTITNTTSTYDMTDVSTTVNVTGGSMAYVYGGGRGNFINGEANPDDYYTPGAVMGNTNVSVGGSAVVAATTNISDSDGAGDVYGGGMEGIVRGNTNVTINGGTYNYVYGGGRGFTGNGKKSDGITDIDVTDLASRDAGYVYGNANITLKSGTVNFDMFGSGEGRRLSITINETAYNDVLASVMGSTNLTMEGGTVKGNVFGGGSLADVGTSAFSTLSGGNVYGSVYGGGKLGLVGQNDGSQIVGTVVNMEGSYVEGNAFAGCYGAENTIMVSGTRTLNMVSGTVVGNIYGGSYSSSDAYTITDLSVPANVTALASASDDLCFINFYGGRVLRSVYGGGYYGTIYGSSYVHVGVDAIYDAPRAVRTHNSQRKTSLTEPVAALRVGNSVYAGSDWGEITETTNSSIKGATGTTNVYVNGNRYDLGGSGTSLLPEMLISNSIYGCGTTTDGGVHRTIYIRNYGAVQSYTSADMATEAPDELSRQLYTIQRCDSLFIDNSNFGLVGKGDVSSFNASVKYGIYNVDAVCIIANNSTVKISAPVEMIHSLRSSYTTAATWSNLSDVLSDLALSDLVTPNANPASDGTFNGPHFYKKNSILVEGGSYLAVRYKDNGTTVHGPLLGYFFLRSSSNAIYAYARPRVTQDMINKVSTYQPRVDTIFTPLNSGDGGFISFKDENQFNGDGTPHYDGGYPGNSPNGSVVAVIGNEYAFSNEPISGVTTSAGLNFRYWAYNYSNMSYRDGVLVAQSDYSSHSVDEMLTANCEVTLPTLSRANAYFVVRSVEADEEIMFEYGGIYDNANHWMYGVEHNPYYYIKDNVSLPTALDTVNAIVSGMQSRPNRDFGLVMLAGESMTAGTKEIINPNGKIAHPNFVVHEVTGLQSLKFMLTYSNKVTNNVELGTVMITLEEHANADEQVTGTTVIRLRIITVGDIPSSKELTNVAVMAPVRGNNTDKNRSRMVLPRLNLMDMSDFWISGIQVMADDGDANPKFMVCRAENSEADIKAHNYLPESSTYDAPRIGLSFGAVVNSDNTDGWILKGGTYTVESKVTSTGSVAWNTAATPDIVNGAPAYSAKWNYGVRDGGHNQYEPPYAYEKLENNDCTYEKYVTQGYTGGWRWGSSFIPSSTWNPTEDDGWLYLGQIDGRQLFSVDFTITYKTDYNLPNTWNGKSLGKVRFKLVYSRYEVETVNSVSSIVKKYYIMDVDVTIKAKTTVARFYVDGVYGDNKNDGSAPYKAKKGLSDFLAEGSGYSTGDIIYVVNGITIDRIGQTRIDGVNYDHVEIMRYPGEHMGTLVTTPTEGPDLPLYTTYMGHYTTDHAYYGALLDVKSDLQMSNVTINGVGEAVTLMSGTQISTTIPAQSPMVVVNEGAKLAMLGDVKLINNNNTANDALASGIMIEEGARLEMADNARVSSNRITKDADVDQAGGIYVGGSIIMSESSYVYDNVIMDGDNQINSNVLLPNPEKYINISTITSEEGHPIDGDPSFTREAKIGVSKMSNREFHLAEPDKYNWYYDVDTTRIAYSTKNEALLSYRIETSPGVYQYAIFDDDNEKSVVYDAEKYNAYAVYFEESADYWKDVVTSKPAGYTVDLYTQNVTISSEEGLAWLISEVYGYNGVTHPHTFDSITITLTANVDMKAHRWTPLGSSECKFKGTFDGGSHTISGIIASEPKPYMGLFGYVENGVIKDVTVNNSKLYGNGYVGGIAAAVLKVGDGTASVTGCSVSSNTQYSNVADGGVTGLSYNATIDNSNTPGVVGVSAKDGEENGRGIKPVEFRGNSNYVGGVAGVAHNSKITNNYIEFVNRAASTSTGMLVGSAENCTIENNGAILAENYAGSNVVNMGGVAGQLVGSDVANNYAVGSIAGTQYAGGVAGELSNGNTIDNCFWISGDKWGNMELAPAGNGNNGTSVVSNSNDFRGKGVNCFVNQPVNGDTALVSILNNWISSRPDSADFLNWIPDAHNDYSGYPVFGTTVRIRPVESERSVDACSQYQWHDTILYESGTYHMTLRDDYNFVDSILTLKLSVHNPYYMEFSEMVCEGSGFTGHGLDIPSDSIAGAGEYVFEQNLKSMFGCDSVVVVRLNVAPVFTTDFYDEICAGDIYNDHGFHLLADETGLFSYERVEATASGCDSLVRLTLLVNSLPELELSGNLVIVEGDTAYVEVSGAVSNEWSTGDTRNAVALAPQINTDYFVRGYNEWGCETEIEFTVKVIRYDEIPEDEVPFDVYPNPTKGKIKVVTYGIERIEVLSPLGQVLHASEPMANECELDLRGYAAGTYLLRVITPYGVKMRHVVKR